MVHTPYTAFFTDAFMAAHVAIGMLLASLVLWAFPRERVARFAFLAAIALVATAPVVDEFFHGFGSKAPPLELQQRALLYSSVAVIVALLSLRRFVVAVLAVVVAILMAKLPEWVPGSNAEICALHMIWVGVALGIVRRQEPAPIQTVPRDFRAHDVAIFFFAMLAAAITSTYVLEHADGSADEWAYTWQAAAFAKGHLYGAVPPCEHAFQSFYVFESMGKLFGQYTPGWPLFMTPFVAFRVPWLAGPVAHGLLAVGVARVARRGVLLDGRASTARLAGAGIVAALAATFATTILLLGASRYSHTFTAALFAWSIEAVLAMQSETDSLEKRTRYGVLLGSAVALMGATRPADGATLAVGLAVYFLYALVRRRVGLKPFLAALLAFVFWGGLTLVILRVQLGTWFTTGYSLNAIIHPWNVAKYGWPPANEIKFALPLGTGSYAWFPSSLAVGLAGVLSLRRRASAIPVMMLVSLVIFDLYFQHIDYARGYDWGYGPRYESPFVVLMATGTGIAFAPLVEGALRHVHARSAFYAGGPLAAAAMIAIVTLVRLWPLLYPGIYAHAHQHDSLNQRIRELGIHHAVVMAQPGTTGFDALDLTENLPIDLYPHQDVLIAVERNSEATRCVRANFPDRALYRASGNPVVITSY